MTTVRRRGPILLLAGSVILALGMSLSLYSVPVDDAGFYLFPFILPSNIRISSFILLQSPLVPLLYVMASALLAAGWVYWRGWITPIIYSSLALIFFALLLVGPFASSTIDFPVSLAGTTFHVSPFWFYYQGPLLLGFSLGGFCILFRWMDLRKVTPREQNLSAQAATSRKT